MVSIAHFFGASEAYRHLFLSYDGCLHVVDARKSIPYTPCYNQWLTLQEQSMTILRTLSILMLACFFSSADGHACDSEFVESRTAAPSAGINYESDFPGDNLSITQSKAKGPSYRLVLGVTSVLAATVVGAVAVAHVTCNFDYHCRVLSNDAEGFGYLVIGILAKKLGLV